MPLASPPPIGAKVRHPVWGVGVVEGFKAFGVRTLSVRFGRKLVNVWWVWAAEKMEVAP